MRHFLTVLVTLAVLMTAGCVEEPAPAATVTATPVTTAPAAAPDTPASTPTPAPEAVAFISGIQCAVGDRSEAAYHCNGIVRIPKGAYEDVQVIAMYDDNNTFRSGSVPLGGNEPVMKPFVIFPDIKYQGKTPSYFVRLDGMFCPVVSGAAMSNMPVPDAVKNH
ncbi:MULTISPECIES: hypothetical protein [unclassified Methanoregula]|uniref:hypothetical protein n=1 Tax=unclassified Methanoregula TaxID=2649730 RepID=UPI0009D3841F|nr:MULTISPECIES: hypothetical protein [unclassified Methanoregula]OPX62171.1 MAG: hypothetical protein A4E33_02437 [Methanoregula sp. PtaB.Bin085]OPY35620.1 MAG: hypothetical protein A4E34_00620 [Methanoregula sp. PtaU1.Bin006]